MADEQKKETTVPEETVVTPETERESVAEEACTDETPLQSGLEAVKAELAAAEEKYLRLAAEYDNFRKRTAKEKESTWGDAKAETAAAFLSVYDNLQRAVKQTCTDEAYAKGVEMTMTGLKDVLSRLGIEEIPALGEAFDANLHNAVMHVEDETVEENTIVEVFQSGFRLGEKILRFAMVKVAN